MTLGELINWHRPTLEDESVGVRRRWEEMYAYTLKHYSGSTPLETFELPVLSQRLAEFGMHQQIFDGYFKRWRAVLASLNDNGA